MAGTRNAHTMPETSAELEKRIRLVRRDIGSMLLHFTRSQTREQAAGDGRTYTADIPAFDVLRSILNSGRLNGSPAPPHGENCVCFTETPIQEFNSVLSLAAIASCGQERPRYEAYGIAVGKNWLFSQGGRPVIYDHPDAGGELPMSHRYRFVPYDPLHGPDYTWEREWRVRADALALDPRHTLVVVPTSEEAFELVYGLADLEVDVDVEGDDWCYSGEPYHVPKWLAVSLDLFGLEL